MKLRKQILSILVVILLLAAVPFAFAQKTWVTVSEAKWQATFSDVFFVDAQHGWIVGSNSTILHTIDGGVTWNRQPSQPLPFDIELKKVRFIDPQVGWVVGDNGTVLKTTDGGQTWMKKNTGTRAALLAVSFADENHGWASGDGGLIIGTKNGGTTWAKQKIDTNNTVEGIHFVSPQIGWAAGGGGTLLYTSMGGEPIIEEKVNAEGEKVKEEQSGYDFQTSATVNTLDAIFMLNAKVGWAVGAGGAIVATVDGTNWEVQASNVPNSNGMPEPIWDVHFADENVGIAAAEFGVILRTKDGGKTWTSLEPRPVAARLQGVHMLSPTEAWIVGKDATILHTTDGGDSWDIVSSTSELRAVHFYDDQLGWAVGLSGSVLHTNDGGTTWKSQNSGDVFELFGVGFVDENKGYIVGSNAALVETLDGGKTWHGVSDPGDEGHGTAQRIQFEGIMSWRSAMGSYAMSFGAPTHAWAVGETGRVMHTNDSGQTWVGQDIDPMMTGAGFNNLYGVHFINANVGWVVGDAGTIAKTTDGGLSWTPLMQGPRLNDVYAIDEQTAWAAGEQGGIMATTDGGGMWVDQTVPTDANLNAILFRDANEGWAVGDNGTILYTADGGVTWLMQESPTGNNLRDLVQTPGGQLWAVGDATTIIRY